MGHSPFRDLTENNTVQFNTATSSHFLFFAQIRKMLQNILSNGNGNGQTLLKGA